MSIPVVADADTLFPATTRGLLIYLDYHGLVKLHWSALILDEVSRALVDTGRKKTLKDARTHEARMCDALPNALVPMSNVRAQFESVAHAVRSAKDTHVAACAHYLIVAKAYPYTSTVALVSRNTKDFKKIELAKLGIVLQKPDAFLAELCLTCSRELAAAFRHFRLDLTSQPDPEVLLLRLEQDGRLKTAQQLRHWHQIGKVEL